MSATNGNIAVFAKAPIAGQVKTRMMPHLSAQQACQLHQSLILHTIKIVIDSGSHMTLWVGSHLEHEFFNLLRHQYTFDCAIQQGADLGQRMYHTAQHSLKQHPYVIIIGTDCPFLTTQHLKNVAQLLREGNECVIIPAYDGGYVLIGLSRVDSDLFTDIAWGEDSVFKSTQERLVTLDYQHTILDPLHDIDRPDDLLLLSKVGIDLPQ